jgi:hypothetical protein
MEMPIYIKKVVENQENPENHMQRIIKQMTEISLQKSIRQVSQIKLVLNQNKNQNQDLHLQRKSFLQKSINLKKEKRRGNKKQINKIKSIKLVIKLVIKKHQ